MFGINTIFSHIIGFTTNNRLCLIVATGIWSWPPWTTTSERSQNGADMNTRYSCEVLIYLLLKLALSYFRYLFRNISLHQFFLKVEESINMIKKIAAT